MSVLFHDNANAFSLDVDVFILENLFEDFFGNNWQIYQFQELQSYHKVFYKPNDLKFKLSV